VSQEEDTARLDQPDPDESADPNSIWERIRALGREEGWEFGTITLEGNGARLRATDHPEGAFDIKTDGPELPVSDFGKKVLGFLEGAGATYKERNAIYQDNFRIVGRVMEALFPNGAPNLHDAHDYNRWHIFELVIVKLTRYVANWGNPDDDSLVDMLPYLSILAAQDQEMREREARFAADEAKQHELIAKLKQTARSAGLYTYDHPAESRRAMREEDNEAKMYAQEDAFDKAFADDDVKADEAEVRGDGLGF